MISHLSFIGARAHQERSLRRLNQTLPLIIIKEGLVSDCDEKAWKNGIRIGDTLRQAKIMDPFSQIVHITGHNGEELRQILDILSTVSPYVEPVTGKHATFIDLTGETTVTSLLPKLKGLFFTAVIGSSRSKLIARASSEIYLQRLVRNRKLTPGKTSWGYVNICSDYIHVVVEPGKEKAFLATAPLQSLWMVPPEALSVLQSLGLNQVRDVMDVSIDELARHIGDWALPVKRLAAGEDVSRVEAAYPLPSLMRDVGFQELVPLGPDLLEPTVEDLSAELIEKGLGFKVMELTLTGDFSPFTCQKKLLRPVCSPEVMKLALKSILNQIASDPSLWMQYKEVSGYELKLSEIVPLQAKPVTLFSSQRSDFPTRRQAFPVSLGMTLIDIESRFGDNAIAWGKSDSKGICLHSEVLRREKMLAFWDPMRKSSGPQFRTGG